MQMLMQLLLTAIYTCSHKQGWWGKGDYVTHRQDALFAEQGFEW